MREESRDDGWGDREPNRGSAKFGDVHDGLMLTWLSHSRADAKLS